MKALCANTATIRDGISAVSCACNPISFNGTWGVTGLDVTKNLSTAECYDLQCANVSSGELAAQSYVCFGTTLSLEMYQASLTFVNSEMSCVTLNVSTAPGRVYSQAATPPRSLSFLQTNYQLMGNDTFAVVTNTKGVTVGQIQSDMITVQISNFEYSAGVENVTMRPCVLYDSSIQQSRRYSVWDLGILQSDGRTIHPLGLANYSNVTQSQMICFEEVSLFNSKISFILIHRSADYESVTAYTSAEKDILLTSGSLFTFGTAVVLFFHIFIPFNVPVFAAGMQSAVLLLFRSIYFFLLSFGDIKVGGTLDFALIEIPTFIYIGIFLQLILVAHWLFFQSDNTSSVTLVGMITFALLVNWIIFAAIMIALGVSDSSPIATKSCDCQISDPVIENNVSQIIRIVYKSFILTLALCVTFITIVFGKKHVKSRNRDVYYEVVGLSVGLLFDSIAFLVYYSVDEATAYFVIVLWFTELLPICLVNGWVAKAHVKFWVQEMMVK